VAHFEWPDMSTSVIVENANADTRQPL
jgi:hypothetical protein